MMKQATNIKSACATCKQISCLMLKDLIRYDYRIVSQERLMVLETRH